MNELIRGTGPSNGTVILIGNGAIENGWQPILEALRNKPYVKFEDSSFQENFLKNPDQALILANAVHLKRFINQYIQEQYLRPIHQRDCKRTN